MQKYTIKNDEPESRAEKAAGLVLAIGIGLLIVYGLTGLLIY